MLPQLFTDIASFTPPTDLEIFIKIEKLLSDANYDTHRYALEDSVMGDSLTSSDIIASIREVYTTTLTEVLQSLGVIIVSDIPAPLRVLYAIAEGILTLGSIDPAEIAMSADVDENDPITRLMDMVVPLTDVSIGEFYTHVDMVDEALLAKIEASITGKEEEMDVKSKTYLDRYMGFIGERRDGLVYNFIRARNSFPLDFRFTVLALRSELSDVEDADTLLWEIMSLFKASDITVDDMLVSGMSTLADLLPPMTYMSISTKLTVSLLEIKNGQ